MNEAKVKDKEYNVTDRPAENGIRLNNVLLSALILVSGTLGTLLLSILMGIASDVVEIKTANSATQTDIINIKSHMTECKRLHESHDRRLRSLEIRAGNDMVFYSEE